MAGTAARQKAYGTEHKQPVNHTAQTTPQDKDFLNSVRQGLLFHRTYTSLPPHLSAFVPAHNPAPFMLPVMIHLRVRQQLMAANL